MLPDPAVLVLLDPVPLDPVLEPALLVEPDSPDDDDPADDPAESDELPEPDFESLDDDEDPFELPEVEPDARLSVL